MRVFILAVALLLPALPAWARDVWFTTSDGARLHYTETGPANAPLTLIFVPGWTMPGWIFAPQQRFFQRRYRVVLFDPRGQGSSQIPSTGYSQTRRGEDIAELIARLPGRVVVIGWSLGVLDTLAFIHQGGNPRIVGLVLVDNSVGEPPAPLYHPSPPGPPRPYPVFVREFVAGMFHTRQSPAYLARLTQACLRLPRPYAAALLAYPVPRSYWRAALLSTGVPVLYAVRPLWAAQAHNLVAERPHTDIAIFPRAGHALFIDQASRFDTLMRQFLERDIHS
jgi:microsomal epoxide hydrolase